MSHRLSYVLFVAAVLASCSSRPPLADTAAKSPTVDDLQQTIRDLPLTQLLTRLPDDDRVLFAAVESGTAECMKRLGFHYPAISYVEPTVESIEPRPFGVWRLSEARSRGYHGPLAASVDLAVEEYLGTLNTAGQAAWITALTGLEPGHSGEVGDGFGCRDSALNAVRTDSAGFDALRVKVEELRNAAYANALADPAVVDASKAWGTCMEQHGYRIASPQAAAEQFSTSEPTPEEITQAVQDVACKESAGLMAAYLAAASIAEHDEVERNPALVQQFQEARVAEQQHAARLAGG